MFDSGLLGQSDGDAVKIRLSVAGRSVFVHVQSV